MRFMVLNVAYPLQPVTLGATGGAEQVVAQMNRFGHHDSPAHNLAPPAADELICPVRKMLSWGKPGIAISLRHYL